MNLSEYHDKNRHPNPYEQNVIARNKLSEP